MVNCTSRRLDRTFSALSDPTRRLLLERLRTGNLSVGELAAPFPISLQAVMKHLDVLADAGLVTRKKQGRVVACALRAAPMRDADAWLKSYRRFWNERFAGLAAFLEES